MTISAEDFKILIVDDGNDTLIFLSDLLRLHHYQVQTTSSSHIALEIAANWQPNLILLDLILPEIDGYQVCQELKNNPLTQSISVICISALTQVENRIQALENGAVDYLTKPLHPEEVLLRVNRQLELQSLQHQLIATNQELQVEIAAKQQLSEELNWRKQQLELILNSVQFGICLTDGEGNIQEVNPAYEQIYGLSKNQLIGQNINLHIANCGDENPEINSLTSNTSVEWEQIYYRRDRSAINVSLNTTKIQTESGQELAVTTVMDITNKKYPSSVQRVKENNLAILVEVQQQLLIFADRQQTYQNIVEILGNTAKAHRIYIFENHWDINGRLLTSQKAEWCACGITSTISNPNLQNIAYAEFVPRWFKLLSRGNLVSGVVAEFPESERKLLEPQGIQSILVIPIFVKGEFIGFIGFDNCLEPKIWETSDIDFLQAVASAISLANERNQIQQELKHQLQRSLLLREITNKIRSQLDTNKILTTAAEQIGIAFGVSRALIHVYQHLPTPQVPILGEFLDPRSQYNSLKEFQVPVIGNPHIEKVLAEDGAVVSPDVRKEPLLSSARLICESLQIKSMLAVRTSYKGEANGMICLHQCDRYRFWNRSEIEFLESIAAQLGIALAHAKLLEQEKTARLQLDQQNLRLQHEIKERQQAETALRLSAEKLSQYNLELTRLATHQIFDGNFDENNTNLTIREIAAVGAENVGVERASIWLYDQSHHHINCIYCYQRSQKQHLQNPYNLRLRDYPNYARVLETEKCIVTNSPLEDERFCDLVDTYLIPEGITAKICVPVRLAGKTVGLFCLEQVNIPHTWMPEDINFARSLGDMLSLILETRSRQQAEQARIASEAKLASAFRSSPDPIFLCRFPEIEFIEVNDSFCSFCGLERQEILGRNNGDIEVLFSSVQSRLLIQEINQHHTIRNRELNILTNRGRERTILLSAELIELEQQQYLLGNIRDITERQQIQQERQLLLLATQGISRAVDLHNAISLVLGLICNAINWDFAEAWLPLENGNFLKYSVGWWHPGKNLEEFHRISQDMTFGIGVGLPGRIWQSQVPEWIADVTVATEPTFWRSQLAKKVGLKSGFGVPIFAGEQVLAVIVFFHRNSQSQDRRILDLVSAVAAQLGVLIQRKQAEIARRYSEERLQMALEASDLSMWDWNLATDKIYHDWRWSQMLEYDADDICNSKLAFQNLIHPDDLAIVRSQLQAYYDGQIPAYEVEFRMRAKSGDWKWIRSRGKFFDRTPDGKPLRLTGTHKDITERKRLERSLALNEARLNAFFSGAPVGMCIVNSQLRFTQINEILAQINGVAIDEHYGKTISQVLPHLADELEPIYQQVLAKNQPVLNREISGTSLTEPNVTRDFLASYFPIPGDNGEPCGVGTVIVEITARKHAERELERVSKRLQLLLTSSGATLFSAQPGEGLEINFVSPNVTEVFCYQPEEILNQPSFWQSRIHPEDRDRVFANFPKLFEQGFHNHDYRFLHGDGSYRWVNTQLRLFRNPNTDQPSEIVGYSIDISERKKTELALEESQRRYKNLAEASPAIIFNADEDGNWLYTNQRWHKLTGQAPALALNNSWQNALHPEDRDRVVRQWQQIISNAKNYQNKKSSYFEYRILKGNGKVAWVISQVLPEFDENHHLQGFVGTITDISERHQAEQALQESAERERAVARTIKRMRQTLDIETIFEATTNELRRVLNCDRVVVYRFNPDWSGQFVAESLGEEWRSLMEKQKQYSRFTEGSITDKKCIVSNMNSHDCQIHDTYLQATEGGAYRRGVGFLCVPDIYEAGFEACYIELLEQFQVRAYITVPIFCGEKLWGLLASYANSGPRHWQNGEISIVVQIGNQLGVALQQAELLAQTQHQSQALQKAVVAADAANRAKSEFLANMSHELRTPLNAIIGFAQLIQRDTSLSKEMQDNLRIINRAGEHLLNLINDILEMSKIEAGRTNVNITGFDLIRLIESLQELLEFRALAKGLIFKVELSPDIPRYIHTDQSKLRQVLLNLLGNAIKFTNIGEVKLAIFWRENEQIEFQVSDTGQGIQPHELNLLFEAFAQTETGRSSQQGTGLGLAISRKYVELIGGHMEVNSQVGIGSTFSFTIPVRVAEEGEVISGEANYQRVRCLSSHETAKILVVDDADDSRLFILKLLKSVGFEVREARNGQEAINIWQEWHPNVILMDMRMPIMDGYTATVEIKSRSQKDRENLTPIIIALTANAFAEQKNDIFAAGCDDLINKPLREDILFEKLKQYLQIEYLYDEIAYPHDIPGAADSYSLPIWETDINCLMAQMPKSWLQQLNHAAASCSDNAILELLNQIPPQQQQLGEYLRELAINFQFEKIMELTDKI